MKIQGEYEKRNHFYYEFDRANRIGEGGMGVVYRGRMVDENTGAYREVAIKEVQPSGDPDTAREIVERAYREASVQLRNDNLVEMLGFVEMEDNRLGFVKKRLYVVSEFLCGVTLDHVLEGDCTDYTGEEIHYAKDLYQRYQANREEIAHYIIKNVLSAIAALHDAGFLHRDIDPSNIMVTTDGKIKLIDFGIVTQLEDLKGQGDASGEGSFVGKVEYAAPELIQGRVSIQDFTTDIYSVGVLFYRLLTGHLPFEGSRYEIMRAQQEKKPDLGKIHSAKYRAIVDKAMSKQQAKRYTSASAMRAALDGPEPAPKWLPFAMAGVVAVAGVLIGALIMKKTVVPSVPVDSSQTVVQHVQTAPSPAPVITHDQVIDVSSTLRSSSDELWNLVDDKEQRAAALYTLSLLYEKQAPDEAAKQFWKEVIVGRDLARHYLKDYSSISSRRLSYVLACMALDNGVEHKGSWIPADFPVRLKERVKELYPTAKNFILPASAQD